MWSFQGVYMECLGSVASKLRGSPGIGASRTHHEARRHPKHTKAIGWCLNPKPNICENHHLSKRITQRRDIRHQIRTYCMCILTSIAVLYILFVIISFRDQSQGSVSGSPVAGGVKPRDWSYPRPFGTTRLLHRWPVWNPVAPPRPEPPQNISNWSPKTWGQGPGKRGYGLLTSIYIYIP